MKLLIAFVMTSLIICSTTVLFACNKNSIYCQIIKNNPKINKKYAEKLSLIIKSASKKYNISARIFTAILMQESGYQLNAKSKIRRPRSAVVFASCTSHIICLSTVETVYLDFGISQIHFKTIARYKFDRSRLTTDLQYSVNAGAKVLADFKRMYAAREVNWWTRYNSSNNVKRKLYKDLVSRYL